MVEREKTPYGYIYRATNVVNGKVYIGQTVASRWNEGKIPIEERWKEEVGEAYRKDARGENLRYVENAITMYGPENFELTQQDIAYNQEELDRKETEHIRDYDSMNPDEGYNLKEGGMGGILSEQAKENLSNVITEKYQTDPEYHDKQANERRERAKNPDWVQKMTDINRERGKNPQWREKMSQVGTDKWQEKVYNEKQSRERQERAKNNPEWVQKMAKINQELARNPRVQEKMSNVLKEKWQESKYQESVSKGVTEKWKDEKYRERQARAKKEGKREIPDKEQFLKDIKEMMKKDINTKYDMDGKSINKRIADMLGHRDVRTYSEAKKYLEDKNLKDVMKDIEERTKEKEAKPSSQEDKIQDKGESKTKEKSKEAPEGDTKKDEKEGKKETPKEDDKETIPEKEAEVSDKEKEQEGSGNSKEEEPKSEEKISEETKPEEKDYAGIDEGISGVGGSEKKTEEGKKLESSSIRSSDIIGVINRTTNDGVPIQKDGKDTRFTSGIYVIDKKAPISTKSTAREGKHSDFSGLNFNLNIEWEGGDSSISGGGSGGGGGGGGGGDSLDYEHIDDDPDKTDDTTEQEGEGGSEGRELSWEY